MERGGKIEHLTYAQSRASEQTLMAYYHTRNWLSENGNNDINGISPKNKNKSKHFGALQDLLTNKIYNELLCYTENM